MHRAAVKIKGVTFLLPLPVCIVMSPCPAGSSSVPEFFRIMTRQFTAHEWSAIQSAGSEHQQLAAFYRHWVSMATILPCHHTALLPGATGFDVCVCVGERENMNLVDF